MALNLSGLSTYTDEHKLDLVARSILRGRTIDIINLQTGIKESATINKLETTNLGLQPGGCGWNSSGTTALTQRTITVVPLKINEPACLDDLEEFYTSKMMKPGSYNEELPFEQIYAEDKADRISSSIDLLAWRGDTTVGGDLGFADGFIKTMVADGNVVDVTGLTLTAGTIVDNIDSVVAAIPVDVIDADDMILFMGYDTYRVYSKALRDANLFHYDGSEDQGQDFPQMVPGTNVRVIAVKGLNGVTNVVATPASNLYMGTDLRSDFEQFRIFYSEDNDEVRFRAKFKIGFNYAFSENVVLGSA